MGLFKSVNEAKQLGKDARDKYEAEGGSASAMDRMKAATDMMAQQTKAAELSVSGIDATGLITGVTMTGQTINMQPAITMDLTIMRDGAPPYAVSVTQVVEQIFLAKATAGSSVQIKVDQSDPSAVWINWMAS
jgi:hypothetical protein